MSVSIKNYFKIEFIIGLFITMACNRAETMEERVTIPSHCEALPANSYAYGDDGQSLYRVITLGNAVYKYRKPDYKGGFYLWMQMAWATNKEVKNQVMFDSLQSIPRNYIIHYTPFNRGESTNDWNTSEFYIFYKKLTPPFDIDTFNYSDTVGWESYFEAHVRGQVPDPMLLYGDINRYSFDKKNKSIGSDVSRNVTLPIYNQEYALTAEEIFRTIRELKSRSEYDTLLTRNEYRIYINTDLQCYEQPAQPDAFYITYMQFYPNGALKERYHFLPGVYTSNTLKFSYFERYNGEDERYLHFQDIDYLPNIFYGVSLPYLFELLTVEGWIEPERGKGKPVMKINKYVDPYDSFHEEERLSIRSMWNIQVDHSKTGSVGLLVKHEDDTETVYIIDKLSGNILNKFKQR